MFSRRHPLPSEFNRKISACKHFGQWKYYVWLEMDPSSIAIVTLKLERESGELFWDYARNSSKIQWKLSNWIAHGSLPISTKANPISLQKCNIIYIIFLALIQSVPCGVAVSVLIDEKFFGFMDLPFLWPQTSLLKLNLGRWPAQVPMNK